MANMRKYGYFKPVKKGSPVRWKARKEVPGGKKKRTG